MKRVLALLLLLIGAKAYGHVMLGENIEQFDEALRPPIFKGTYSRKYNWGSDNGTDRWLAACVDGNGTVQAVYFFKKN
jgi:hypothetical protein